MSKAAQPAACSCGQVLFETSGRKSGDVLTCPWCQKKYRYLGDNKIESFEEEIAEVSGELEVVEGSEEVLIAHIPAALDMVEKKSRRQKRPQSVSTRSNSSQRKTLDENSAPKTPSARAKKPKDIPGGTFLMVCFVAVFNGLAFITSSYIFVTQTDGARLAPWGQVIHKKAIWPEIAALVLGHVVGFIAWTCYIYFFLEKRKMPDAAVTPSNARKK
jgi:hypothetical protein